MAVLKPVVEAILAKHQRDDPNAPSNSADETAATSLADFTLLKKFYTDLQVEIIEMLRRAFPSIIPRGEESFAPSTEFAFVADSASMAALSLRPSVFRSVEAADSSLGLDNEADYQQTLCRINPRSFRDQVRFCSNSFRFPQEITLTYLTSRTTMQSALLLYAIHGAHQLALSSPALLQSLNFFAALQIGDTIHNIGFVDPQQVGQIAAASLQTSPRFSDAATNLRFLASPSRSQGKLKEPPVSTKSKSTTFPVEQLNRQLNTRIGIIETEIEEEKIAKDERFRENARLKERLRASEEKGTKLFFRLRTYLPTSD